MPNLEYLGRWDLGGLGVQGPRMVVRGVLEDIQRMTYNAGGIGSTVIEAIIER